MRKPLILLICFGLALHFISCTGPEPSSVDTPLRIGILPDESAETLRERYTPLFDFISRETGLDYHLIIPSSYGDMLTRFGERQIDLAYFGGVTFVKANSSYGAIPIAMRDVDSRFTSVFIVRGDSEMGIRDLVGKNLAFGSRLSTSGHLMPRYFLQREHGITPEEYFNSVQYTGKHDRTAYWVRDGEVDVGTANAEIIRKMYADGRLQAEDIRIIWTTPPYADYVWAVQPQISDAHRQSIQQAFLKLSVDNPQHKNILSNLGANGFYPASPKDFSELKRILMHSDVNQR